MDGSIEIPSGSIYLWMYTMGLKHVNIDELEAELVRAGRPVRQKDLSNYWRGWYNSDLYHGEKVSPFSRPIGSPSKNYFEMGLQEYPENPYIGLPEIAERWVPCKDGKPLIKWSNGCMDKATAIAWPGCNCLAENTRGTQQIIIDCDGDHDPNSIDWETIEFLSKYKGWTHTLEKPSDDGKCKSFHLTFTTDRMIPTMHFPDAHIDIIGNQRNSLRYIKNKQWNGLDPMLMTDMIWDQLKAYIERRMD